MNLCHSCLATYTNKIPIRYPITPLEKSYCPPSESQKRFHTAADSQLQHGTGLSCRREDLRSYRREVDHSYGFSKKLERHQQIQGVNVRLSHLKSCVIFFQYCNVSLTVPVTRYPEKSDQGPLISRASKPYIKSSASCDDLYFFSNDSFNCSQEILHLLRHFQM